MISLSFRLCNKVTLTISFVILIMFSSSLILAHDLSGIIYEREKTQALFNKLNEPKSKLENDTKATQNRDKINKVIDRNNAIELLVNENNKLMLKEIISSPALLNIITRSRTWSTEIPLKICFIESGANDAKRAIAVYASEWTKYGNIQFDFGPTTNPRVCEHNDGSNIRITFASGLTSSSRVGTDSQSFADNGYPTMQLPDFGKTDYFSEDFKGTVLHEFGHALGFQHENQHPLSHCQSQINFQAVEKKYNCTGDCIKDNFDQLTVSNRFKGSSGLSVGSTSNYKVGDIEFTAYDNKSVMHYALAREVFYEPPGDCYISKKNNVLSEFDKKGMQVAYPNSPAKNLKDEHNAQIHQLMVTNKQLSPLTINALRALQID